MTGAISEIRDVSFATGIKVRPLLTRVQAGTVGKLATSDSYGVFLENGDDVGAGFSIDGLLADENRVHPLYISRITLVTSGISNIACMFETQWWKILMPNVRVHFVGPDTEELFATLHYRFAELTDDEIVEIAAQRAN
jgi:hypothetical protein